MRETGDGSNIEAARTAFREGIVEADGFCIHFMEAGQGVPLLHLHGAGGLHLTRAHDLLSQYRRVIAFEMPGFGRSPENIRTRSMEELAATMATAATQLDIDTFDLMGTSFGGKVALWLAVQQQERLRALVLEAPAAVRPPGTDPPSGSPEELASRLYARPERLGRLPVVDPVVQAKNRALAVRLRGADHDPALELRMRGLITPTLVLFGTLDRVIPPEMGRHYRELIPNCHLVFVYDAGHGIRYRPARGLC